MVASLEVGKLQGKFAALTFDDGDISLESHIVPALKRRELPATFFINSAYYEQPSTYWAPIASYFNRVGQSHQSWTAELADAASKLRRTTDATFYQATRVRVEQLA